MNVVIIRFYVSAPRSIIGPTNPVQVGGVFQCPKGGDYECLEVFKNPFVNRFTAQKIQILPLFGMTILDLKKGKVAICGPNLPFSIATNYFCFTYNKAGGDLASPVDTRVDNYGMILEDYNNSTDFTTSVLIGQVNDVYYDIRKDPTEDDSFIIIQPITLNNEVVSLPLKSIPSFKVLINHQSQFNRIVNIYSLLGIIVFYSLTNNYCGSFDVFTDKLFPHQSINVPLGYPGQFLGFSAALASFNKDQCKDIAAGAPFHTTIVDEGHVYIYMCNPLTNKFMESPTIIDGENLPFARFGTAIASLGDIDNNGCDGNNKNFIKEIAVLASNWYSRPPCIYIYKSDENGISKLYAQKIVLQNSGGLLNSLTYGINAGFDEDEDGVNDLSVSFPNNNKVIFLGGIHFTQLTANVSYNVNTALEQPALKCFDSTSPQLWFDLYFKPSQYYLSYVTTICISLLFLKSENLAQNIEIRYKVSLENKKDAYFFIGGQLIDAIPGSFNVNSIDNQLCRTEQIYLLYYPDLLFKPLSIALEANADVKSTSCGRRCIKPDPFHLITNVRESFPSLLTIVNQNPDLMETQRENLTYSIYINNNFTAAPLENIVVLIEPPTSYGDINMLSLLAVSKPNSFFLTSCSPDNHISCGPNTLTLISSIQQPNSVSMITLQFTVLDTIWILRDIDINALELNCIVKFSGAHNLISQTLLIKTSLAFEKNPDMNVLIWPIIGACILSIFLLIIIGILIWKVRIKFPNS
ncbi:hypothetical protein HZS_7872 [Henneguya salminicola]|nr:hypothetical protein HZS_7872 [Henneguya salminicola]